MANYRLRSATEIGGTVRMAGTTITQAELDSLSESHRELLINEEHLVQCEVVVAPTNVPASPFPRKREQAKREKTASPVESATE